MNHGDLLKKLGGDDFMTPEQREGAAQGGRTSLLADVAQQAKRLRDAGLDADTVTASVLRMLLDMDITPRRLIEGSTLEEIFLKLTGIGQP